MIWQLDVLLFVILIAAALLALRVRDLLAAVALLAGYSLFAALLFAGMAAVDVALVEAALGAGVTGVLFIAAILTTSRRSADREGSSRRWLLLPAVGAFVALMLWASAGLPDRGDPEAPAHNYVAPAYLSGSLEQTETPNVVTAVLADYRSMDTFGETLVIFTASLAAALVLWRGAGEPGRMPTPGEAPAGGRVPGTPGGGREQGDAGTPRASGDGPGEAGAGPGEAGAGPGEAGAGPGEAGAGPGEAGAGPGEARDGEARR